MEPNLSRTEGQLQCDRSAGQDCSLAVLLLAVNSIFFRRKTIEYDERALDIGIVTYYEGKR